jgi:hypothetical protein
LQAGIDGDRGVDEQDRVAIWLRLRDDTGAQHAARAGTIIGDDRLLELGLKCFAQEPASGVYYATGRVGKNKLDRVVGIRLGGSKWTE